MQHEDSSPDRELAVVALGASAGGLEALEQFFAAAPADSGLAFVVIQHLSPDFESRMDELLGRKTDMPVTQVRSEAHVEPDHVYVAPPNKEMIIANGRLLLTEREPDRAFALPIDRFFRSLASDFGSRATAVVLSGSGSDGSRGVLDVHAAGGLVLAQDPDTARFDSMPASAIRTEVVDLVLPPADMPVQILEHARTARERPEAHAAPAPDEAVNRLTKGLRDAHGIDFAQYKQTTLRRRIQRRTTLRQLPDLDAYADHALRSPGELEALYRDLLIGVTEFFRDEAAFVALGKVIDEIIAASDADDEIRVWVAGCASGQEAYSIAILFHERLAASPRLASVKIFATDAHDRSLQIAGAGRYRREDIAGLSEERRARYFEPAEDGMVQVAKTIRQMLVFAPHDVLRDAPFTRMALVSCRNLLIYLRPQAQKKVLSLLHFALRARGYLLLGTSETPGDFGDELEVVDEHAKLFRKRRDLRLPVDRVARLTNRAPIPPIARSGGARRAADARMLEAYDQLLAEFAPCSLLVDHAHRLLHTFGGAERLLRIPAGRAAASVLDLLPAGLRTPLGGCLARAASDRTTVHYSNLTLRVDGREERLGLRVSPIRSRLDDETDYLIVLAPAGEQRTGLASEVDTPSLASGYIQQLEADLNVAQESLQATVEQLETSNEELQATNEELVASNEELQSTNEELHSVNEELYSVNAEHERQIDELVRLTADMDNLLASIDVGVLFIDRQLHIRRFTPRMAELFHFLPQDVGRRFDSFVHELDWPRLSEDVNRCLEEEEVVEREVRSHGGASMLLRVLPYRDGDETTGAVITVIDISSLRQAEARVRHLSSIVESAADAMIAKDFDNRITAWNDGAAALYGFTAEEALGMPARILYPDDRLDELESTRASIRRGQAVPAHETTRRRKDGSIVDVSVSVSPMLDAHGQVCGASSIARDITRRKQAEQRVHQAIVQRDRFIAQLSHELRNPLMGILTAAEMLSESRAEDTLDRVCAVIGRQSQQMARLLDDLLDVSRLRRDKIDMRRARVTLDDVVEAASDAVIAAAREADVRLEIVPPEQPVWVDGDLGRLQQLVVNLLDNAIKYTPSGRAITLRFWQQDGRAMLRVDDEGVGIATAAADGIFEPFGQLGEPLRGGERSMGLGLALVQAIARGHDGEVVLESEGPGRGSSFIVTLPAASDDSQHAGRSNGHGDTGKRLLLVEDEDDNRELLARLLRTRGYEVTAVATGLAAVEAFERAPYDVAVMDVGLPDISGLEVARRVRARAPETFFVALTGHGRQRDREAVLEAGFDQHLVKPVRARLIEDVIRERRK